MFSEILPETVKTSVLMGAGNEFHLLPEERVFVRNAVPKRIGDFAGGRYCAREALKLLNIIPSPILVGPRREPLWPDGIVGSITHCEGCCAAAVSSADSLLGIGIDVEPSLSLPPGVREMVVSQEEAERFQQLPSGVPWDRLLFSAKESIYKAWYPLTGVWLDFLDATLEFHPHEQSFAIRIHKPDFAMPTSPMHWFGRYGVSDSFLYTAVTVVGPPHM